jgi:hypothetical protein
MDVEGTTDDLYNSLSTRTSDSLPVLEMALACQKSTPKRQPGTFLVTLFEVL